MFLYTHAIFKWHCITIQEISILKQEQGPPDAIVWWTMSPLFCFSNLKIDDYFFFYQIWFSKIVDEVLLKVMCMECFECRKHQQDWPWCICRPWVLVTARFQSVFNGMSIGCLMHRLKVSRVEGDALMSSCSNMNRVKTFFYLDSWSLAGIFAGVLRKTNAVYCLWAT
jgi:uncharacterized membrane-anchored protein YitT (DUF2179 family)